jgi:hypothetical protein
MTTAHPYLVMPIRRTERPATRGGFQNCTRCGYRYSAGSNPGSGYVGLCGICAPRCPTNAFADAAAASAYRIECLVAEGRMRDSSRHEDMPASRPELGGDRPDWEELQ